MVSEEFMREQGPEGEYTMERLQATFTYQLSIAQGLGTTFHAIIAGALLILTLLITLLVNSTLSYGALFWISAVAVLLLVSAIAIYYKLHSTKKRIERLLWWIQHRTKKHSKKN